jgi:hypothetical protein
MDWQAHGQTKLANMGTAHGMVKKFLPGWGTAG